MKNIFILLLFIPVMLSAQTIEMDLPSCLGSPYSFCLMQGVKQDTVLTGKMAEQGKTTLVLPAQYASYRGVGKLLIQGHKSNNIILNGEEKIVVHEVGNKTVFEISEENKFIDETIDRQKRIMDKYYAGLNTAQVQDLVYQSLEQERASLENQYAALRTEIAKSPLYAARLLEILNCLIGAGNKLNQSPEVVRAEQQKFITEKLDFNDLYTSSFWQPMIDLWFELNRENDTLLVDQSRQMLDKLNDIPVRRELTQSIIRIFSKYRKDYLLSELGTEYLTMPLNGQFAPEIQTDSASFLPKNALIMFYETGCGMCHNELEALKNKYQLLVDNRVRVISIAADVAENVFEYTASRLPWEDKYCDFKGFEGINFRNYGIVGTPTFILIDKEGIVRGRYAELKEWLKD